MKKDILKLDGIDKKIIKMLMKIQEDLFLK